MSESGGSPALSVVIATRNRADELPRALRSVREQTVDVEVIVLDDASDDTTADVVQREFPEVRYFHSEQPVGYIRLRNKGAELARAPVFTTFDDDAELISPRTFEIGLAAFDHPRVAAVGLPTVEIGRELMIRNRAPSHTGRFVSDTFPGAASLIRRDVFLALGGFREELIHRGEEFELCRRFYSRGYVVRICAAPEVHHHVSSKRLLAHDVEWHTRSMVLQAAWAMRKRDVLTRAALSLGYGARRSNLAAAFKGLGTGTRDAIRLRRYRNRLPDELLALLRRMERERVRLQYGLTIEDVDGLIPRIESDAAPGVWPLPS